MKHTKVKTLHEFQPQSGHPQLRILTHLYSPLVVEIHVIFLRIFLVVHSAKEIK